MSPVQPCTVVIGSFLEAELVERIATSGPDMRVLCSPELLPVPRYVCDHNGSPRDLGPEQLSRWEETVAQADVFFDFDWFDPAGMPGRCPDLKWIQATSAGIGAFMQRTGLDRSGFVVTTAGGIHAVPLAEFALMGVLYFVKGLPVLGRWQAEHHWERYTTCQLSGLRVLIVGLGGVGRRVATVFAGLGVEVWGLERAGVSRELSFVDRVITRDDLDEALPSVDALILCCPLTKETEGLIGADQIGRLGQQAVVVNISRGQVIDQGALLEALQSGRIGGACLDVFAEEPLPVDNPLWDLDNVIVSPHSASTVVGENTALVELFIDNLDRFRQDQPLRNRYDPAAGY
jgi:phosphoglycerate dehydrogenase-like enzyme